MKLNHILLLNRLVLIISFPINTYFISTYLTNYDQGIYFMLINVVQFYLLFDAGFQQTIIQVIHKKISDIRNNFHDLSKLISIIFYRIFFSLLFLLPIMFVYIYFFLKSYLPSYLIVCILLFFSFLIDFLLLYFLAIYEGQLKLKFVYKFRLIKFSLQLLFFWVLLYLKFGFISYLFSYIFSNLLILFSLYFYSKELHKFKIASLEDSFLYWKNNIGILNRKVTLSFVGSFVAYNSIIPITFYFLGPTFSGVLGLSLAIFDGILSIVLLIQNSRFSFMCSLVTKKKFSHLNSIRKELLIFSVVFSLLALFGFYVIYYFVDIYFHNYTQKVLAIPLLLPLSITVISKSFSNVFVLYMKSFFNEPIFSINLLLGFLMPLVCFFSAKIYGGTGVIYAYSLIFIFVHMPLIYLTFRKERAKLLEFCSIKY